MCFYIYSPEHCISIIYASESISVYEDYSFINSSYFGTSDIIVDILLKNEGRKTAIDNPDINKLFILYPNNLIKVESIDRDDYVLKAHGHFVDLSQSLTIKDFPFNHIYYEPGNNIEIEYIQPEIYRIKVSQPNPITLDTEEMEGYIKGKASITPATSILDNHLLWLSLEKERLSILECDLDYPIPMEEKRWFRFVIRPEKTSYETYSAIERDKKLFLNELVYPFEIAGPYNVHRYFFSKLKSLADLGYSRSYYKKEAEYIMKKLDISQDYFNSIIDEYILQFVNKTAEKMRNHISEPFYSRIKDWRINLYPKNFIINNLRERGNLLFCATGRNKAKLIDGSVGLRYQWKTGKNNLCYHNELLDSHCSVLKQEIYKNCSPDIDEDGCYPFSCNFQIEFEGFSNKKRFKMFLFLILLLSIIATIEWGISPIKDFISFLLKTLH